MPWDQGESVTLADGALARRYLDIEQIRFGVACSETLTRPTSPSCALLLQPLLENAVARRGARARAQVRSPTRRDHVVIKVTNTVPAGPGPQGHGLALDNVRDRLSLMHDVQGQFRSALKDGVFQVRIEVPV
jgi:two-component system sensor histidine kinase AlgZ